ASPFENSAPARPTSSTASATSKPAVSVPTGPRALSRNQPQYPARAQALRIEGRVKVKFDVTSAGRVENVQILSAQPANMFEREVKNAMRKWRYEAGKPGSGLVVNIIFRLNGTAQIE
ncbi:TonB system transport protein TonB, partial [Salmonella enterica subsp. enterica serovar Enteritidis]|nr:TonB system transport protein TonB [Salmonella enterica subsp. enterica serovar Enteritidis]